MFYTGKKLVRSFDYNDIHQNRHVYKKELINGRTYYKEGVYTATTVVGDLYKVACPGVEQFNYVLLIGIARQHPNDAHIDVNTGTEIAAVNAKTNPVASIKLYGKIDWDAFKQIAQTYIDTMPAEFVRTKQEIDNNNFTNILNN